MLDNPFTLSLLFLMLLGDGDVVAGICSLLWLFVPIGGRHTPFNSTRRLEFRPREPEYETDDESEDEQAQEPAREQAREQNEDGNEAGSEDEGETQKEAGTETETDKVEVVPSSTAWKTYWH